MSYPNARYLGDKGEISAIYRPADQEPELTIGSSTVVRYLATGASTNGQFGLYRWDMGPQPSGPSAHFHKTISESFFILSGTVRLFNGERWIHTTAGISCTCPRVECTPSATSPVSRHRCCCSSPPARRARHTSKHSPSSPQVVGSARRSGRRSASVTTATFSDRWSRCVRQDELKDVAMLVAFCDGSHGTNLQRFAFV